MRRKLRVLSAVSVLMLVLSTLAGAAEPPLSTLADGHAGTIQFQSVTLNTRQFLQGEREGKPVVLSGDLQFPEGVSGRVPAMVIVHGSAGISSGTGRWADELRKIGVATFLLDSFSGRGFSETFSDQSRLGNLAMLRDAYRALELLVTHPRIDRERIGVIGFSKGAVVALWASFKRFQRLQGPPGLEFAVYIPFYPSCNTRWIGDEDVSGRPIRIFHGEVDNQALFSLCKEYIEQLRRAGKDARITGYLGAHHGFDRPETGVPRVYRDRQNWSKCFFDEARPHQDVKAYVRSCVSYGVVQGYDSRAHGEALNAVRELLTVTFNLAR